MSEAVIEVSELEVRSPGGATIVDGVSFDVDRGEIVGLVGESGSGKTTTGLALLGYGRRGARITGGRIQISGIDVLGLHSTARRQLRGRVISYVPQEPGQALNPSLRIGDQISEMLRFHAPERCNNAEVAAALATVGLPSVREFQRRFPHQLSGGQQQRVAIAAALAARPVAVVFDEPTTGLDVATQAVILDEIRRMRRELNLSTVYISHDLAVISAIADRVVVMYGGLVVEDGPVDRVLAAPRHPYTRALLSSVPDHVEPRRLEGIPGVALAVGERVEGCPFYPRCPQRLDACREVLPALERIEPNHHVRCIAWASTPPITVESLLISTTPRSSGALLSVQYLTAEHRSKYDLVTAADSVSFDVQRGQAVALVGESGSGKTTIARCIAGLHRPTSGHILFDGTPLAPASRGRPRELRRRIQIVFQNPHDSLNPRQEIAHQIARPAVLLRRLSRGDAKREVAELLEQVRMPQRLAQRYPVELSGGERQRVAIARALAARPELLICDEITSALDVSVQAAVLDLLADLQHQLSLTMLFISHDLGVVATVADHVIVLNDGRICETGPTRALLRAPASEYTKMLLDSVPRLELPETVVVRSSSGVGGSSEA